jgi:hypothetical protein
MKANKIWENYECDNQMSLTDFIEHTDDQTSDSQPTIEDAIGGLPRKQLMLAETTII